MLLLLLTVMTRSELLRQPLACPPLAASADGAFQPRFVLARLLSLSFDRGAAVVVFGFFGDAVDRERTIVREWSRSHHHPSELGIRNQACHFPRSVAIIRPRGPSSDPRRENSRRRKEASSERSRGRRCEFVDRQRSKMAFLQNTVQYSTVQYSKDGPRSLCS